MYVRAIATVPEGNCQKTKRLIFEASAPGARQATKTAF